MTRSLVLLVALFLVSSPTHAGSVEVAQWVPWNFLKDLIPSIQLAHSYQQSSLTINAGEFRPLVSRLELDVSGKQEFLEISKAGIETEHMLTLSLKIGAASIDQLITRVINGNVLSVRIKADCAPFDIIVPRLRFSTFSAFTSRGKFFAPELSLIDFDFGQGLQISNTSCTGIGGLSEEIAFQLRKTLGDKAFIKDLIFGELKHRLEKETLLAWNKLAAGETNGFQITGMDAPLENGIIILGKLALSTNKEISLPRISPELLSPRDPQFILSEQAFNSLIESKLLDSIPSGYNLQEVKAFSDLMKNRFLQYFVWQDLTRFSSNAPFMVYPDKNLSSLTLTRTESGFNVNMASQGVIRTLINSAPIDYLVYSLAINGPISMVLSNGVLAVKSGDADVQLAWAYGLLYSMIYKPKKGISTKLMREAFKPFFSQKNLSVDLPILDLGVRKLKLSGMKNTDGMITMDWL